MGIVTPFRRRIYPRGIYPVAAPQRGSISRLVLLVAAAFCVMGCFMLWNVAKPHLAPAASSNAARFATCGYLIRDNCVVDGDTFFIKGEKIRIADIDAPETSGAQCADEADLGARAKARLRELLNEGPFELRSYRSRDTDRYGRKLRTVVRDGRSIGELLISEGLARRWEGRRRPWCV